jgi:hypothetical protein
MDQIIQIVGAMLVLSGFAAVQFRWLNPESLPYLVVNALGAGVLTVLAVHERQWGFLLLEAVWTAVSLWGLYRLLRGGLRPEETPRTA